MTQKLGFIGLGNMGGGMARNLLKAGRRLLVFDIEEEKLAACLSAGATGAGSTAEVVQGSDVVMTSLPDSQVWVRVSENDLLPNARQGQIFIDLGTVIPAETRRMASALAEKGATLLDVPVSGGPVGARDGTLRMFAGGGKEVYQQVRPVLELLGNPDRIVYCGPSGAGQVVKGVNQLVMGLSAAGSLEALVLGMRAGADPQAILQGVGFGENYREHFADITRRVLDGKGDGISVKQHQYAYFLDEADRKAFDLPITRALQKFMMEQVGEQQNTGNQELSLWKALMNYST